MKYNTLRDYHEFLKFSRDFSESSASTYSKAVDFLLSEQLLIDCREQDIDKVIEKMKNIKHKKQYSKYKSAFLYWCEFLDIELDDKVIAEIESLNKGKTKKHRKLKTRNLSDIKNHVMVIRDKKLKLSYEVMLATGLRVFELSQIARGDCEYFNDQCTFTFLGKGQRVETVTILKSENEKLYFDLQELLEQTDAGKKVFYSANYLQSKAIEKGFSCHDLRRAFAKIEYKKTKDIEKVMESMRHQNIKTTKLYLNSKIDI